MSSLDLTMYQMSKQYEHTLEIQGLKTVIFLNSYKSKMMPMLKLKVSLSLSLCQ